MRAHLVQLEGGRREGQLDTRVHAFAAANASYVLALAFLRLPIAALIGFLIFDEVPEIWVWIGAAVICTSSTYIARREAKIIKKRG